MGDKNVDGKMKKRMEMRTSWWEKNGYVHGSNYFPF